MTKVERWIIRFVILYLIISILMNKVCNRTSAADDVQVPRSTPGFTWEADEIEQIVWNTLRTEFSEQATAAIMGNMKAESGICPFRYESLNYEQSYQLNELYKDNENKFVYQYLGFGLCGWTGIQNKQRLWDYCEEHEYDVDDAKAQVLFMIEDLKNAKNHCYDRMLMYKLEDLCIATEDFRQSYEASIRTELSQYNRQRNAKMIFDTHCEDIEDIKTVAMIPYTYDIILKVKEMNEEIEANGK